MPLIYAHCWLQTSMMGSPYLQPGTCPHLLRLTRPVIGPIHARDDPRLKGVKRIMSALTSSHLCCSGETCSNCS